MNYFNGDSKGDEEDVLNGYDRSRKADIKKYLEMMPQIDGNLFCDPDKEEYEITTQIVDAVTTTVQVDGGNILKCYDAGFLPILIPHSSFTKRGRF